MMSDLLTLPHFGDDTIAIRMSQAGKLKACQIGGLIRCELRAVGNIPNNGDT